MQNKEQIKLNELLEIAKQSLSQQNNYPREASKKESAAIKKIDHGSKRVVAEKKVVNIAAEPERLNKLLARLGICSRRAADQAIVNGEIKVDGVIANLGTKVSQTSEIVWLGKPIKIKAPQAIYLALNKPKGIVCTTDQREPQNIIDFLNFPKRIFPIGRLDKDSTGLILLTNDGDIVNQILRERYGHSKEYLVEVNRPYDQDFVKAMTSGVKILDQITKPCKLQKVGPKSFRLTLTQGLNRQIRRMCEALGYRVVSLERIRIMHITLGNLKLGEYRYLTDKEIATLKSDLKKSLDMDVAGD